MKTRSWFGALLSAVVAPLAVGQATVPGQSDLVGQTASADKLKVVLLGTAVGPKVNLQQFGASTLIEAGGVRLLFDCGRGSTLRLGQAGVPLGSINRVFLTHLHTDHVIQLNSFFSIQSIHFCHSS